EGGDCPELFPANLAEGSSCSVDLGFLPTRIGLHSGSLAISSNAKDAPTSIALSGRGAVPALGYTPTWLHFAHSAAPQLVTITNPGRAALVINSLTISDTFTRLEGGSCAATWPSTLAPGGHCTLQITPVVTGATSYSGTISIASNVPGGPYQLELTGGALITPTHTAVISTTALTVTDTMATMEATLQRTAAITEALSLAYRVTGERPDGQGNLVLARGSVTFAPAASEATLRLNFDRLSLYGVRSLLLELGEPAMERELSTRTQLALPLEEAFVFLPLIR
ncbi:MAG: choice-of-anchor D domain-containing protein, partial [Chloroflexia bacterium]|nr:choice-of-anchor D domain-containing protein [Chloroflexia bacterium]